MTDLFVCSDPQCNIISEINFGGGSLMVWAHISFDARTELVVRERGTLNSLKYITNIRELHVDLFEPFIDDIDS